MSQSANSTQNQGAPPEGDRQPDAIEVLLNAIRSISRLLSGLFRWIKSGAGVLTLALAFTAGASGTLVHMLEPSHSDAEIGIINFATVIDVGKEQYPSSHGEQWGTVIIEFPAAKACHGDSQCKETIERVTGGEGCSNNVCRITVKNIDEGKKDNSSDVRIYLEQAKKHKKEVRLVISGSRNRPGSDFANILLAEPSKDANPAF